MDVRPKTLIVDIDGTILYHHGDLVGQSRPTLEILPGVLDKFNEWDKKGYRIILLTGRKESMRELTEGQLKHAGLFYDMLIMGVGGGARVLINDLKTDEKEPMAVAVNVIRNAGLANLDI